MVKAQSGYMDDGTIVDRAGPYNFSIQVTVSGKLAKWKRHADQLKKCYDSNNFTDITPETVNSQEVEKEEEKENSSEVIVYGNFGSPQQMTTQTTVVRRNPPRNRPPPDRLTY